MTILATNTQNFNTFEGTLTLNPGMHPYRDEKEKKKPFFILETS